MNFKKKEYSQIDLYPVVSDDSNSTIRSRGDTLPKIVDIRLD